MYQEGSCNEILVKLKTWIKNKCKYIFEPEFLNFEKIFKIKLRFKNKVQNKVKEKILNTL